MAVPSVYQLPIQLPLFPDKKAWKAAYNRAYRSAHADRINEQQRARYQAKAAEIRARRRAEYAASSTLRKKAVEHVRKGRLRDITTTKERRHQEYLQCREAMAEKAKAFRRMFPDIAREKDKKHYDKHQDANRARAIRYYQTHKVQAKESARQWRDAHRDYYRAMKRAWQKAHPLYARRASHMRRIRLRAAEGSYTVADILALQTSQAGLCAYCSAPYGKYEIEHKQPLSRGGSNHVGNICLACEKCNGRKGAKTEAEFRALLARS